MSRRSQLTESEQAFVLAQRVARLATMDEAGEPHLVPVCYAFNGQSFYTPLDEKPKRVSPTQLRRVRNIEARPQVGLVIDYYAEDWSRLGYVSLRGQAELLPPATSEHSTAVSLLRARYLQYATMNLEAQPVIRITPTSIAAWGTALTTTSGMPFGKLMEGQHS